MFSKRTELRLRDIIEDAMRIETFVEDMSLPEFLASERTIFAVERLLQRITEAALQIDSEDAAAMVPPLPIAEMRGLGNRLRHEYRDIDRGIIYDLAVHEVPALRVAAEIALG